VRIVWVQPSTRGVGLHGAERRLVEGSPNYQSVYWRPPHIAGIRFGELDSSDIRGLCAMIARWVPVRRIRYILGATGEGARLLRQRPEEPLSQLDFIFIEGSESMRAWLLSNPLDQDPLDLLVYCYRDEGDARAETPALRGRPYVGEDAVSDMASQADPTAGQMHTRAPAPDAGRDDVDRGF